MPLLTATLRRLRLFIGGQRGCRKLTAARPTMLLVLVAAVLPASQHPSEKSRKPTVNPFLEGILDDVPVELEKSTPHHPPGWTWTDASGQIRTPAELDAILADHIEWLNQRRYPPSLLDWSHLRDISTQIDRAVAESIGKVGFRPHEFHVTPLRGANLGGAILPNVQLAEADLTGTNFTGADLTKADFAGANLTHAHLSQAKLASAGFDGGNLRQSFFNGAHLSGASLTKSILVNADFTGADLSSATLSNSVLRDALLNNADIRSAILNGADLAGAQLQRVFLNKTLLFGADVTGVIYEPADNPTLVSIADTKGLGRLIWAENPEPIYTLRKLLNDAGFRSATHQVNAAIKRRSQSWLEGVLFDSTCAWGTAWDRPLIFIAGLCFLCTWIYWAGIYFGCRYGVKGGLFLVATGQRITTGKGKERVLRIGIHCRRPVPSSDVRLPVAGSRLRVLSAELRYWNVRFRMVRAAFLFSLMSVFNIGFREFNFGRWIRMLQSREFDIRARGWLRIVSGIQSLFGVTLLALSLLSYFGHPFE